MTKAINFQGHSMASVQHIVTGNTNPTSPPPSVGAHYINTTTGQKWLASGTNLAADWGLPLAGAAQISGTDVSEFTLPTDGTVSVWRVTGAMDRVLIFPGLTTPGLYTVELIAENVQASALSLIVAHPDGGALVNFGNLPVKPAESKYFKFHCWVGADGYPYWTLSESESLSASYEAVTDVPNATVDLVYDASQPLTYWTISDATARSISFPSLGTFYTATRDLVIKNDSNSAVTIAVSSNGQPLKDNTSLSVPANSAVMYRLAYYTGSGVRRWSIMSTTVL
jgi:hypothetical protein